MDSLPYGGDNDGTQPLEADLWLESTSMQQLLAKEGEAAAAAASATPPAKASDVAAKDNDLKMMGFICCQKLFSNYVFYT